MVIEVKQKDIKKMIAYNEAVDIDSLDSKKIPKCLKNRNDYDVFMKSYGVYGMNGMVLKCRKSGKLYAIASRSTSLWEYDKP